MNNDKPLTIAGIPVQRTGNIINENTRICDLTYAYPKSGKTTLSATFHEWCLKEYGKPGLFIVFESADGGGVSSVQDYDVPYVQPTDIKSTEGILRTLLTDSDYAAVFVDNLTDLVQNVVKPYALKFPSRENIPTRAAGVPERSDYQTIGEKTRELLNMMIALTKSDPRYRKHLIVNALLDTQTDKNGNIQLIGPDLPGALRESGPAPFELVSYITIKDKVVNSIENPTVKVRQKQYTLVTQADGVRVAGDRYKVFPAESPADWGILMEEYWKPKIQKIKEQNNG